MKRSVYLLAGLFLVLAGSLFAQDIDPRVATLEVRGRHPEALALFLRGADTGDSERGILRTADPPHPATLARDPGGSPRRWRNFSSASLFCCAKSLSMLTL